MLHFCIQPVVLAQHSLPMVLRIRVQAGGCVRRLLDSAEAVIAAGQRCQRSGSEISSIIEPDSLDSCWPPDRPIVADLVILAVEALNLLSIAGREHHVALMSPAHDKMAARKQRCWIGLRWLSRRLTAGVGPRDSRLGQGPTIAGNIEARLVGQRSRGKSLAQRVPSGDGV